MRNNLQRVRDAILSPIGNELPRGLTREVGREIEQQSGRGLVQAHAAQVDGFVRATTINVTADVTRIAMTRVGELSAYEDDLARLAPRAEPRVNLLVNAFTTRAASEIHPEAWS